MKMRVMSIFVDDQEKAKAFYTDVLGFQMKHDIPLGEFSWITVVSPENPDGPELLLEPAAHPAVKPYRDALMEDGIPLLQLDVEDCQAEYDRLTAAGVTFTQPPTEMGPVITAVFDDSFGNLVQIAQMKG